jgi:hypothetical protein
MGSSSDFAKFVPGFDFLQGLVRNAGAALPGMGQWIAPTLDPEELDKRIDQLKTVQFWLEQNARMIAATVQALEVQRMTLSTLRTMNLPMADVADAFRAREPLSPTASTPPPAPERAAPPAPGPAAQARQASGGRAARPDAAPPAPEAGGGGGMVDPMKWWSALTEQFTQLATHAMKDVQAASQVAGLAPAPAPAAQAKATDPAARSTRAAKSVRAPKDRGARRPAAGKRTARG